jgi:hypothetical protein
LPTSPVTLVLVFKATYRAGYAPETLAFELKPIGPASMSVGVVLVDYAPGGLLVEVEGVTNGAELVDAIKKHFHLTAQQADMLELRVGAGHKSVEDDAAVRALFGGTRPICADTPFPDEQMGLVPDAYIVGRFQAGRRSPGGLIFGRKVSSMSFTMLSLKLVPLQLPSASIWLSMCQTGGCRETVGHSALFSGSSATSGLGSRTTWWPQVRKVRHNLFLQLYLSFVNLFACISIVQTWQTGLNRTSPKGSNSRRHCGSHVITALLRV